MFDLKRIKNLINPLNAIITGVIILFILSRVISINHENAFVIEEISKLESHTDEQQPEQQLEQQSENQSEPLTKQYDESQSHDNADNSVNPPNLNASKASIAEPLAYSAELDQTFTLEAFNKLSKEDLMTFTGIGEVTAQAILDYRRDNGPFGDFEDLMLVKGIGEKKLQKIMTILP